MGTRSICTDVRSLESLADPKVSRRKRLVLDEKRMADWRAATSNALLCGSRWHDYANRIFVDV